MFESLTERLSGVFGNLGRRGRLSEKDVDAALREVRMALLEADVNFRVARQFVASVRERAVGREVTQSVTPAQQVTKIVHDNLVDLLGGETARLATAQRPPSVILMVGSRAPAKPPPRPSWRSRTARTAGGRCWWRLTPTVRRPSPSYRRWASRSTFPSTSRAPNPARSTSPGPASNWASATPTRT